MLESEFERLKNLGESETLFISKFKPGLEGMRRLGNIIDIFFKNS